MEMRAGLQAFIISYSRKDKAHHRELSRFLRARRLSRISLADSMQAAYQGMANKLAAECSS